MACMEYCTNIGWWDRQSVYLRACVFETKKGTKRCHKGRNMGKGTMYMVAWFV